jgi:hypothetical protein
MIYTTLIFSTSLHAHLYLLIIVLHLPFPKLFLLHLLLTICKKKTYGDYFLEGPR